MRGQVDEDVVRVPFPPVMAGDSYPEAAMGL